VRLFSKTTPTLPEPPKIEIVNPQSVDEQCETCHRYITAAHTPEAQDVGGEHGIPKHTYCSPACVPPSLLKLVMTKRQEVGAQREVAARDAIELAKANRIITLRNQIAYCEEHKSALEAAGVDYDSHVKQFTDALAAELEVPDMSPHLVIKSDPNQIVENHGKGFTSFITGDRW
jgi:hypothetical protein